MERRNRKVAIEKRAFGKTGHMSSAVIFGAAALWDVDEKSAGQVLDLLFEYGVNHIDVAPGYGTAELRVGEWMPQHRKDFFLATKTKERSYTRAKEQLHQSLDLLKTDKVDLIQLHSLTHPDEWDEALGPGGALDALMEARDQGLTNHIGVTGHGWTAAVMHRRSLDRFDFDSILLPWNWFAANHATYPNEFEKTVAYCATKNMAVQTTWYQALEDEEHINRSVNWVLSDPRVFLNSVGDLTLLPPILRSAANATEPPSKSKMVEMGAEVGLSSIFGI
jgi:aryl-alcohol dehydrogenase-like predicted oxidoreductase